MLLCPFCKGELLLVDEVGKTAMYYCSGCKSEITREKPNAEHSRSGDAAGRTFTQGGNRTIREDAKKDRGYRQNATEGTNSRMRREVIVVLLLVLTLMWAVFKVQRSYQREVTNAENKD